MISFDPAFSLKKRAKIGCVAGLVGGFAIFISIFLIDLSLGSSQGAFYKIVGLAVGSSGLEATLIGMVSHMAVASLIGTVFGMGSGLHKRLDVYTIKKGALAGIVTGLVVFGVFFVPISFFVIMPTIQSGVMSGEARTLLTNSNFIMISSAELHAVFGVIMGIFFAIAIQVESKSKFALSAEAKDAT
jgi:hypothetical protein